MSTPTVIPPAGFQLEQDDSSAVQPPAGFQLENPASPEVKPPAGFQLEKTAVSAQAKPRPVRAASASNASVSKPPASPTPQVQARPDQPHLPTNLVRISPAQNQSTTPEAAARQQRYREAERLYGAEVMAENQRRANGNGGDPRVKWADEIPKAREQGRIEGHSRFYSPLTGGWSEQPTFVGREMRLATPPLPPPPPAPAPTPRQISAEEWQLRRPSGITPQEWEKRRIPEVWEKV